MVHFFIRTQLQLCILNVNKIDVARYMFVSKIICKFLFSCFKVIVSKISVKTDKFSINHGNLFWVNFLYGHSKVNVK